VPRNRNHFSPIGETITQKVVKVWNIA